MAKAKTFDFIDTETGEKFSETKKELAAHAGISRPTISVWIRTGRLGAKETGVIDNSPKLIITRIVNGKPDVFVGTKKQAAKYYGLSDYAFRRDVDKGEIIVDECFLNVKHLEAFLTCIVVWTDYVIVVFCHSYLLPFIFPSNRRRHTCVL